MCLFLSSLPIQQNSFFFLCSLVCISWIIFFFILNISSRFFPNYSSILILSLRCFFLKYLRKKQLNLLFTQPPTNEFIAFILRGQKKKNSSTGCYNKPPRCSFKCNNQVYFYFIYFSFKRWTKFLFNEEKQLSPTGFLSLIIVYFWRPLTLFSP